ncbi:hypothetical protein EDF62_1546 [Leucobacter luti]|uniref:Uncharacterized protein n=1 Tax=Leucobacter luti TaxID=340320 RepID=A0A4R6RYZ1_9MICO|nr:hypothetical protein [Leucobacter luti]TDP92340.1 hypothetical protein EDF62_1546 [Leucobacter luti]
MPEYWLGVITPFAVLAGLALTGALGYLMFRLGDWLGQQTHYHFVETINLEKNRRNPLEQSDRPEFQDSADKLRDALLVSPKLRMLRAFGRIVLIARDYEKKETDG